MLKRFFKNNRCLIVIFCIMVILSSCFSGIVAYSVSNYNGITIVIDPGHGGRDGGSVGVNGTIEKEINLKYAQALKERLVRSGYRVELTRKTDDGLYSEFASNKKMSDMRARFNIIQNTNPNLVISIHMNSFGSPSAKGALTYYRNGDEASKRCADLIQASLNTYCDAPTRQGKVGDYYMPNLVLEKEKIMLNKYGRMRLKFLKENKKAEYTIMFVNGTLNKHLKEIQQTAQERIDIIIEQLKQQNNLTEEMKNTDQLYWVSMMNNFKNTAEEIVLNELIYA